MEMKMSIAHGAGSHPRGPWRGADPPRRAHGGWRCRDPRQAAPTRSMAAAHTTRSMAGSARGRDPWCPALPRSTVGGAGQLRRRAVGDDAGQLDGSKLQALLPSSDSGRRRPAAMLGSSTVMGGAVEVLRRTSTLGSSMVTGGAVELQRRRAAGRASFG